MFWPLRPYMRDLWAGLLLRLQGVKTVTIDNAPADVKSVGPLLTELTRDGAEFTRRNADILSAIEKPAGKQP